MIPNWTRTGSCSVIAHRGGAALGPENSVEVLGAAVAAGTDVVEIDVQELGDGSLVLFHDKSIRKCWRRLKLRNLSLARFTEITGRPPELLEELIERVVPLPIGLYLEVKFATLSRLSALVAMLSSSAVADRTIVGSFDHSLVRALADDGRLSTSVLYSDRSTDPVELAHELGCTILHPCFDQQPWMVARLAGDWMRRVHDEGLAVIGWNANVPDLLDEMAAAGFDALCTDDPRLVQHASWRAVTGPGT